MSEHLFSCPVHLDQESGSRLYDAIREQCAHSDETIALDMEKTAAMDSFGGAWLLKIAEYARRKRISLTWKGQTGDVAAFMEMLAPALQTPPVKPRTPPGLLEQLGGVLIDAFVEFRQFANLMIDALYWMVLAPLEGRGFRFEAFLDEVHEMGVRAVRIVLLMNFLMGLIIAMLSAKQVETFGIQIYVANLIIIAFARELAAITTAVVVSARSGAAIAAELATMVVQEEIDALRGMGIHVVQYLVVPKLLAMIVVLPCLVALGMVAGIAGGSLWGIVMLQFRPSVWWNQTLSAAFIGDFVQGMLKTLFFAVAIALIGCHNGLRVKGGSRGVGLMTTRAVVMDIFMLICINIVFATVFYYIL